MCYYIYIYKQNWYNENNQTQLGTTCLNNKQVGISQFPVTREEADVASPWDKNIPKYEHRMLPKSSYNKVRKRLKMLGNIVVPSQGRFAFNFLCG